jgi:hypothetical protein
MPRGGARKGAGRKAGTATVRSRSVADKLLDQKLTPLQVLVEAMELAYEAGDMRAAANMAEKAAPYMHPRLSSVNAQTSLQGSMQVQIINEFAQ